MAAVDTQLPFPNREVAATTITTTIEQSTPAPKAKIGIIYPPPEVRHIVDKTASFVAKNGPEFESRVKANEVGNNKFMFLNPTDPYHGYYQHKLKEFMENKPSEPNPVPSVVQKQVIPPKVQRQVLKAQAAVVPTEPPREFEFVIDPPSVSQFELDLLKLSAQFVARNGRKFLTGLMNREHRNPQFDFLRPQHNLFPYFTKLIEHYTKILIYPKTIVDELRAELSDPRKILREVLYRVEWSRHKEREKQKVEEAIEREKLAYARIDWHDFVIVETVDFQPNEMGDFPSTTTASDVGARLLEEERINCVPRDEEVAMLSQAAAQSEAAFLHQLMTNSADMMDMESDSGSEDGGDSEQTVSAVVVQQPRPDEIVIKKHYDPKADARVDAPSKPDEPFLISPITGEKVPASKITDHIRFATLDPRWAKSKERELRERMEQDEVYAPGTSVQMQLKKFAERRTDIFGDGDQETIIGKKIGEEEIRTREKPIWDGHSATMEKTSKRAMEGITIDEQIQAIHRSQGLIEDESHSKIGPGVGSAGNTATTSLAPSGTQPPLPAKPPVLIAPPPMVIPQVFVAPPPLVNLPIPPAPPVIIQPPPIAPSNPSPNPRNAGTLQPTESASSAKKMRLDTQMMTEEEFLNAYGKDPVQFTVEVPRIMDKPEWRLQGQTVKVAIPPTDMVSVIKAKLTEILGLPGSKQKLQLEGTFLKDSNTLAFYNITPDSVLQLVLKERGGRKK